jgi:hypothetical protein
MKIAKSVLFLVAGAQTTGMYAEFWPALNHRLAAMNFRHAHAAPHLGAEDGNITDRMDECWEHAEEGLLLSLQDVGILKALSAQNKHKRFADRILLRNHANIVYAAREVKAIILSILVGIILYKNRELLGKRWENVKNMLAGIAFVWLLYTFRDQISNGVSKVTGTVRSAVKD